MYSKMRFRRRRKSARRIIVPICLIFVGALVIVIGSSLATGTRAQRMGIPLAPVIEAPVSAANTAPSEMDEPTDASSQVNGKWYGLCAKNSSRSVEDMRRIVQSDPVLVKYFADVDWNKATAEKLQEPASVYVAYRKNDVIRYTTRRIHLPRGEPYITDGKRNIKSSCCNDFVDEPPGPQAQKGPGLTSIPAAPPPSLVERYRSRPPEWVYRPHCEHATAPRGPLAPAALLSFFGRRRQVRRCTEAPFDPSFRKARSCPRTRYAHAFRQRAFWDLHYGDDSTPQEVGTLRVQLKPSRRPPWYTSNAPNQATAVL